MRVAINAQFSPDQGYGGVSSVLIGLVAALGKLDDGEEEYLIITSRQAPDWLAPHLGSNQRIVCAPSSSRTERSDTFVRRALLRPLLSAARAKLGTQRQWPEVPISTGFYESLKCDLLHFPYQHYTLCALPTIYNPHDLQHRHFPQFFTPAALAQRETIYPTACRLARTVVVGSNWVKQDLIDQYGIGADKIQVIPWAPPTQAYMEIGHDALEDTRQAYHLPAGYAFFPAVTWQHKNHLALLEALAYLRDRHDLIVPLVCTGNKEANNWPAIEAMIGRLKLGDQVQFLGRVSEQNLRAIYRLAQFVVVPTLFEAASGPVFEAWEEGVPVACSAVTSLPEQVEDAALLFDPYSIEAIADAVRQMATNPHLRTDLVKRGQRRLKDFSWTRTAKGYRAVYRQAVHQPLSDEDRCLLSWDWMKNAKLEKDAES